MKYIRLLNASNEQFKFSTALSDDETKYSGCILGTIFFSNFYQLQGISKKYKYRMHKSQS